MFVSRVLAHPLTKGLELDDSRTTELRRRLILAKPFLRKIYVEWYEGIIARLPEGEGRVLELGSGGGFLLEYLPELITSDVQRLSGVSLVADGRSLPFLPGSLRGIVMTNALHHIPEIEKFFRESAHVVRKGGVIVVVEPWVSGWARWVYRNLHHERFDPDSPDWSFPSEGPLSGSNGALPWIVFERDRSRFESVVPGWKVRSVEASMPLRYLISGGVSLRSLAPGWSFELWRWLESAFEKLVGPSPMFATIVLERVADEGH